MRANELRKYKTLDITELSGSPWNNAEKVLGLDENDKVIMAEPDDVVTPEYVDNAIDQAMEAETARTEDAYAKKDEIPDMEDYYTKEEVDEAISGITVDLSDYYTKEEVDELIEEIPEPDLSNYYTKGETDGAISTALVPYATKGWVESKTYVNGAFVDAKVNEAMQSETARTESTYAKPSDIPSLDGYATEEYVDNAVSSATQDMATEQYVNDAIAAIPVVDLSGYAKTTAVTQDIQTAIATETGRTESVYAKKSEIPSLDNYYNKDQVDAKVSAAEQYADSIVEGLATETYVDDAIAAIPPVDLSGYALISSVTADINTAIANETARTESTYAKPSQIPSLDGYATEQWVESQGYLTEHQDLSAYAKTTAVTQDIQTAMAAETARTESTYLKEHQSLDNYYTKSEVDADFVSAATAVGRAIDTAVQGLASEDYVDNAVAGLATEEYVDNAVAGIVFPEDYATTGDVANAVEGLASESYVDNAISTATQGMATQDDLEGLASESYVDDAVNGVVQGIGMLGMVNDVSANGGTVTVRKTGMENGQIVTGSTSFNIVRPEDLDAAMDAASAWTDATYAKKTDIPSLAGYATEAWVEGKGYITGVTVDDELSSSSTNPVENKVIYEALNGVTSTTQLEMTSASTNTVEFSNGIPALYLYDTNHPDYQVAFLGDAQVELGVDTIYIRRLVVNGRRKYPSNGTQFIDSVDKLGNKIYYEGTNGQIVFISSKLDGTFDYYLVYNKVDNYVVFYKTLPTIVDVTDHTASISDIPTAQDGSDFNKFVYFNTSDTEYGNVVSKVYGGPNQVIGENKTDSHPAVSINTSYWGRIYNDVSSNTPLPYGNEVVGGAKTARDSVTIDKAEQALSGLTETITLTLGSASTDTIRLNWNQVQLLETDTPRYLVAELTPNAFNYVETLSIGGIIYIVINRNYATSTGFDQRGTYQLAVKGNDSPLMTIDCSNHQTQNYLIIDKELLTLTIAENLTITRAKNIQEALDNIPQPDMSDYVSKDELTGSTEQQAIEIGADDTGATITIYSPNGLETLNLKSTSVNKYKVLDISGWATSTNIWPQFFSYSGISQMGFQDFVMMALDTPYTLTQGEGNHSQITFSGTSPRYIVLNIEDNTVYVSDNLPSVAVEVPGVLDDYAKTTAVTEDIASAIAAETARTESTYLKEHQDISGKLDKTDFNTYTGATETALAEKLDASAYTVDNAIDSASTNPVENRVVANALDNKAEKTNVDANTDSRYFPLWNSDGVVIGKYGNIVYKVGFGINGWTYNIYRDKKSEALPSIYAPISAGTQGQILVSTGGKPVWSDNNFVTSGDVATQIGTAIESETARTESTYAKPSQIPSLNGYATEQWVQNQGYLTQHQSLAEYYTKTEIDGMIGDIESLLASI